MKKHFFLIATTLLLSFLTMAKSIAADVNGVRFWQDPEKTRLVFDLSDDVNYKIFTLSNPVRLVVDITGATLKADLDKVEIPKKLIKKIRASKKTDKLRLVIDLSHSVTTKDFKLKPFQKYGHRLVVDLKAKDSKKKIVKTADSLIKGKNRDIIIAIDAGHGGEDPGAPGGEKQVCLAVAKKLAALINKEKGLKAILTRTGDYYVGLTKRTEIARKNRADLFISLHADGFTDKKVRGTSVWIISPKGANSEMGRWLEQNEKASDLVGGVDISHQDPMVAKVLLDLSTHYSVGESIKAGDEVRKELSSTMTKMHGNKVKKAAFVVLKMPDIPAMLVEMGFISNKAENKQLKSSKHQKKIAQSILTGVTSYFSDNPPDGSLWASVSPIKSIVKTKYYKVKSGDTLSQIASNHGVSTKKLKKHNQLKSDSLRIGQVISIPGA